MSRGYSSLDAIVSDLYGGETIRKLNHDALDRFFEALKLKFLIFFLILLKTFSAVTC